MGIFSFDIEKDVHVSFKVAKHGQSLTFRY